VIKITVAYAGTKDQIEIPVEVSQHCTVALAIRKSGILSRFPEINFPDIAVGIFSKKVSLDDLVKEGDRVEIYRPLKIDPKEARRLRAKKNKN